MSSGDVDDDEAWEDVHGTTPPAGTWFGNAGPSNFFNSTDTYYYGGNVASGSDSDDFPQTFIGAEEFIGGTITIPWIMEFGGIGSASEGWIVYSIDGGNTWQLGAHANSSNQTGSFIIDLTGAVGLKIKLTGIAPT